MIKLDGCHKHTCNHSFRPLYFWSGNITGVLSILICFQANDNPEDTPRGFGRSNPFEVKESAQQKTQKDLYKDELQKQVFNILYDSIDILDIALSRH